MTQANALEGVSVIEVTRAVRGRYCGRLFAELGAHVVRIEAPGDAADPDRPWLDPGKRSAVLDWHDSGGRQLLDRLLTRADVFIEDLDATDSVTSFKGLAESAPRLIHVSLTPFGLDGPWEVRPGPDLLISALSGMAAINRVENGPPVREPGPQTEIVAALSGFIGALAALHEREHSGLGQQVEVSSLEAMVSVLSPQVLQQSYQPGTGARRDTDFLFPCADGWMSLIVLADPAWEATVLMLQLPIEPGDERFSTQAGRRDNFDEIRAMLTAALAPYPRRELFEMLSAVRVVCGMVLTPADLRTDPHASARDALVTVDGLRIPRVPIRIRGESLAPELQLPARGSTPAESLFGDAP